MPAPQLSTSVMMETSTNLESFLSNKWFISTLNEGYFAVLTLDLRKEIWSRIEDDGTLARASRVNKRWLQELTPVWEQFVKERGFLENMDFWSRYNKNWKWVLRMKTTVFTEESDKNGVGTMLEMNGPYEGEWKGNKKEGIGKKIFNADKSTYLGEWKDNMKDGFGIYVWEDKTKYTGGWKQDKYHGFGVKSWSDGDKYSGGWKEDKKQSSGTYVWSNGDRYEGSWEDDKQHGHGVFVWATGVKYVGNFKENMRNDSHATLIWPNGDRYEGGFKDNMIEGQGLYQHSSGDIYIGQWKASQRHGSARYVYQYGGKFEGFFIEDERNGAGLFEWPDGDRYEGTWRNGGRQGPGVLRCKNGQVFFQDWNETSHSNYAEKVPRKYPNQDF